MSVFIDNVEIKTYHIEIFEGFIGSLILRCKALEEEGKRMHDNLKDFRKGDVVQIKDFFRGKYSGVWEIEDIKLSVENKQAPAIYSFYIKFRSK